MSVLQGEFFSGHIIGSGLIEDVQFDLSNAKILTVRGPMTAERVSVPCGVILSNPGLLVSEVLKRKKQVRCTPGKME